MSFTHPTRAIAKLLGRLLCIAAALFLASPAMAARPQLCFSDVTIRAGTSQDVPPVIDGTIGGDIGWINAWRNVFNNGTFVHDAVIQGIKDANNIYLSFEVNHDDALNTDDAIVIAFDPTGAAANRRLLQIFPVIPAGAASPVPVKYWQGFPWSGGGAAPPAGTVAAVTVSGSSGNRSWFVELKLPMAIFGIPPAGNFALYVNVMPNKGGLVQEYPWPTDSPSMVGDLLNTPPLANWGPGATNATTCNGVYITESDIFTDNSPPSLINTTTGAVNTFHAIAHNTTIDNAGNPIAANNVRGTFRIANFGLSNSWAPVRATDGTTNPTAQTFIGAGSTANLSMKWTLDNTERSNYAPPHHHQCILVDLDSSSGTCVGGTNANAACSSNADCTGSGVCEPTLFSVRSIYRNMDFGTNSTFVSDPQIDPRGWKAPPAGRTSHRLALTVTRQEDQLDPEFVKRSLSGQEGGFLLTSAGALGSEIGDVSANRQAFTAGSWQGLKYLSNWPVEANADLKEFIARLEKSRESVAQLTYLVHGCVVSDQTLTIHNNVYPVCERVGSFGYVVRHVCDEGCDGGKAFWKISVDGPGLADESRDGSRFSLNVPKDKPVTLPIRITVRNDVPEKNSVDFIYWLIALIAFLVIAIIFWLTRGKP